MKKLIFILLLSFGLNTALMAQGSYCAQTACTISYWEPVDDDWVENAFVIALPDGTDVEAEEERWVNSRGDAYLNYNFGTYTETSPHTDVEYRFEVYCKSWEQYPQPDAYRYNRN